ncbi:hypothetical protein [Mycobacterium deserti]|uniref:Lipoprotein LpqS n=1 Tax=Mycobacterium deserti TaxID=2978347 RepID=A0ABT2M7V8_9MYCO|nr:hypothetical protein [Mycobacterium deserti]MCT7657684.1 hypothetical protein [Mycobacterium deserti]
MSRPRSPASAFPRGVAIAGRVVAVAGVAAAGVAIYLLLRGVDNCGALTDSVTWQYARKLRPVPDALAACERPLAMRAAGVMTAAKAAAMLFVVAAAVAMAAKFAAGSVDTNRGDGTTRLSG